MPIAVEITAFLRHDYGIMLLSTSGPYIFYFNKWSWLQLKTHCNLLYYYVGENFDFGDGFTADGAFKGAADIFGFREFRHDIIFQCLLLKFDFSENTIMPHFLQGKLRIF